MLRLEQSENHTRNQPDDRRPCQRRVNLPLGPVRHLTRRRFCEPALVELLTQHERSSVWLKVQVARCTLNERADGCGYCGCSVPQRTAIVGRRPPDRVTGD
jgi:hypothetical protein